MEEKSPEKSLPSVVVQAGAHVVVDLIGPPGQDERLEFDLVANECADLTKGFVGMDTPLAKAVFGQPAGSVVPYHQSDINCVRIVSIAPGHAPSCSDAASQRAAAVRKAVEEAQRTDAIVFASSFSGKWGDYDPQGMEHWKKADK